MGSAAVAGPARLFLNYAPFLANRTGFERQSRCLPLVFFQGSDCLSRALCGGADVCLLSLNYGVLFLSGIMK
jgi:hypothetical protein